MLYRDQLKRHHPFNLVPPEQFALHTHRLVQDLQRLLRRVGLKSSDPHRIAKLLDGHLDAVASHYCNVARARKRLMDLGYPADLKKAIAAATDGAQLRALIPDIDIYKGRQSMVPDLLDVPAGIGDISGFIKLGVLALWKVADAIDAAHSAQSQADAITKALPLVLEAIDSAHFCFLVHETDVLAMEEPAVIESAKLEGANNQYAQDRRIASDVGLRKGEGRRIRYAFIRLLSLEIANDERYSKLEVAQEGVPPLMLERYGLKTTPSSVRAYLCEQGWKAFRTSKPARRGR